MFGSGEREVRRRQKAAAGRLARAAAGLGSAFPMPADTATDDAWDLFAVVDELLAAVAAGLTKTTFRVGPRLAAQEHLARLREVDRAHGLSFAQRAAVDELDSALHTLA